MDTNDPANTPTNRGIASELYGGDSELRLKHAKLVAFHAVGSEKLIGDGGGCGKDQHGAVVAVVAKLRLR